MHFSHFNYFRLLVGGLLILAVSAPIFSQTNDGWVLKNEKSGVKVYYRKTSDLYELKLTTALKAPLSGMVQLFDDVSKYTVWGYKVTEARLVKRVSPTEMYYYAKIDFPWPMSDRDLVMHTKLEQLPDCNTITSTSVAVSGMVPESKDMVRIKKAHSKWTVTPGTGGWLAVEYYLYSDPGGNLPDWAVNLAVDVGPRETIKNIRETLKDPRYQNTKLAHIRE